MCIQNRLVSLCFRGGTAVLCVVALLGNTGLPVPGNFEHFATVLQYFSSLLTIVAFVYYLVSFFRTLQDYLKEGWRGAFTLLPRFKGGLVILMLFEMLIYGVFLSGTIFSNSPGTPAFFNILIHYIVPLLVILDYILFDRKGSFHKIDPIYWLAAPLVYFLFSVIGAQLGLLFFGGSSYPYYFINPDLADWGRVLLNVMYFTAAFLLASILLLIADKITHSVWKRENDKLQVAALSAYSTPAPLPKSVKQQGSLTPEPTSKPSVSSAEQEQTEEAETGDEDDTATTAGIAENTPDDDASTLAKTPDEASLDESTGTPAVSESSGTDTGQP